MNSIFAGVAYISAFTLNNDNCDSWYHCCTMFEDCAGPFTKTQVGCASNNCVTYKPDSCNC